MEQIKLNTQQKLDAIAYKYYQNAPWNPKKGDYYTLTRNSMGLELFQIVEETETEFGIKIIWDEMEGYQDEPTMFEKSTFLEGFGECRVHLPHFILGIKPSE